MSNAIKWTMNKEQTKFTAEVEGYELIVSGGWYGWGWEIKKDGESVDYFMHHRPVNNQKDSTTVRVDCERKFTEYIKSNHNATQLFNQDA